MAFKCRRMKKTYCFKSYNSKQNKYLDRQISLAGSIYNHCIALHKRYFRLYGRHLSGYALQKHITKLKKLPKYSSWNKLGSQAIQDIVQRIDRGYTLFFNNRKRGIKTAPPSFKKCSKYKSFTLKQSGYKLLSGNKIKIGDRVYKYFKSREIEGQIKTLTVKRDNLGDIYLFFVVDIDNSLIQDQLRSGKIVGFDFGLKTFLTSSDGNDIKSPLFFKQSLNQIRRANRSVSHKQRGSKRRHKAVLQLVRIHRELANRRRDFHFKLANRLTDTYEVLIFEDLTEILHITSSKHY